MQFKYLPLAALAATASAQSTMNLTATLAGNGNLTNLTSYLGFLGTPFQTQLAGLKNVTLLAPSNQAFANFLNSSAGAAIKINDTAAIQAVLMYHVLNGTYDSSAIKTTPAFIPTMLNNKAYSNVTGGQRVEAMRMGTNVTFVSGLLAHSNVTQAVSLKILYLGKGILLMRVNRTSTSPAASSTLLTPY